MRSFYLIAVIVSVVLIQSCAGEKEKAVVKKESKQPGFKFTEVKLERPTFTISLPGELKPYEEVDIYAKVKGFARRVYVDRGSYVRKGQLLAQLEAPELGAGFAARTSSANTAYQKFLFSRRSYNRLKEAAKKNGAVAAIELEKAYTQYLGDSAAWHSSRADAAVSGQMQHYLRITAPFSGIINTRFVSEGALVGDNGEPMFRLTQANKLRLEVAIPEKQAQSIARGARATFSLVDFPGNTFTATLSRTSGALDAKTKSVIAEFDIPNPAGVLRSGQYARVVLQLQRPQPTTWVPPSSLVESQAGVFVIKKQNQRLTRVPVSRGLSRDTLVEVYGDLHPGDKVLLKGSEEVKEGTVVGH